MGEVWCVIQEKITQHPLSFSCCYNEDSGGDGITQLVLLPQAIELEDLFVLLLQAIQLEELFVLLSPTKVCCCHDRDGGCRRVQMRDKEERGCLMFLKFDGCGGDDVPGVRQRWTSTSRVVVAVRKWEPSMMSHFCWRRGSLHIKS